MQYMDLPSFIYTFVEYALCGFALCMELPFDGVFKSERKQ